MIDAGWTNTHVVQAFGRPSGRSRSRTHWHVWYGSGGGYLPDSDDTTAYTRTSAIASARETLRMFRDDEASVPRSGRRTWHRVQANSRGYVWHGLRRHAAHDLGYYITAGPCIDVSCADRPAEETP